VVSLLDVNILLALAWPNHLHHDAAHTWFASNRHFGWATSSVTQAGFVRISCQSSVTHVLMQIHEAVGALAMNTSGPDHHFWKHDTPLSDLLPEMRTRIMGPKQLTDAMLLDLAIRNGGKLATFDRRIEQLLPPQSKYSDALEILPIL
jgi:toxin-antitoxin system PIN domain toxin